MRTTIKGKNLDVPARDRGYAERKLARLDRLLGDRSEAVLELSTESHRSAETSHIVDVSLVINGRTLRGSASAATHRAAIDQVLDKLERQAVSHKDRPLVRRRAAGREASVPGVGTPEPAGADEPADEAPRIVKTKRFAIEPMFEEDAVARMEELGHAFFVFVNAENEQLAVLYRRADGDYGLIEPAIGGEYTPGAAKRRRAR
ncbi:MAG TPA: ribosome-associated translation inhibitor RaiA [Candidatus Limnocylindria bacterium]|nr:ribosome-associated translation inhibitor RaiA [Candidatus Limnocylindria bacterium]